MQAKDKPVEEQRDAFLNDWERIADPFDILILSSIQTTGA